MNLTPFRSAALGLLLVSVLAACSANAGASGVASLESQAPAAKSSAEPSASLDPETAQLRFAQCMRDHGIDMSDPETAPGGGFTQRIDGRGVDPEKMQAAQEACDDILNNAGGGPKRELDPEQLDKMVEFAQCMREHGIDMPDPSTDGKGGIMFRSNNGSAGGDSSGKSFSDGINPESEEFQAAQEACSPILGSMGPDGGPKVESGPGPAKP